MNKNSEFLDLINKRFGGTDINQVQTCASIAACYLTCLQSVYGEPTTKLAVSRENTVEVRSSVCIKGKVSLQADILSIEWQKNQEAIL